MRFRPSVAQPHETLALIELETGHRSEAIQEARIRLLHGSINPRTLGEAGYVFAASGHRQEAQKLLTTLKDMVARRSASPVFLAVIYMGLEQHNAALDAIEECVGPKSDALLHGSGQWHFFDELKSDPRYQSVMARAKDLASAHFAMTNRNSG